MARHPRTGAFALLGFAVGLAITAVGVRALLAAGTLQTNTALSFVSGLAVPLVALAAVLVGLTVVFTATARRSDAAPARTLGRVEFVIALVAVVVVAVAALADAAGALLSVGLVGFGITMALQRPILAVAGWWQVTAGGLFREGDRIEVAGIVGDVLVVGLFSTRLWEVGSESSSMPSGGTVSPQRPTGRTVTLSNAVFLEQPVANASSGLPVVFDEFAVSVAYEADVALAERTLREVGAEVLDLKAHRRAAKKYGDLTHGLPMEGRFPSEPVVIRRLLDHWIELRLRYLVDVRDRAATRSSIAAGWLTATGAHPDALPNVYYRLQQQNVGADGRPKP